MVEIVIIWLLVVITAMLLDTTVGCGGSPGRRCSCGTLLLVVMPVTRGDLAADCEEGAEAVAHGCWAALRFPSWCGAGGCALGHGILAVGRLVVPRDAVDGCGDGLDLMGHCC